MFLNRSLEHCSNVISRFGSLVVVAGVEVVVVVDSVVDTVVVVGSALIRSIILPKSRICNLSSTKSAQQSLINVSIYDACRVSYFVEHIEIVKQRL